MKPVEIATLIEIDKPDDDKIYTDFRSNEFLGLDPSVKHLLWGQYHMKPVAQVKWESLVNNAAQIAATVEPLPAPFWRMGDQSGCNADDLRDTLTVKHRWLEYMA